jgi:hypothetical protein
MGQPLEDDCPHAGEAELAGEHEAGATGAHDDDGAVHG